MKELKAHILRNQAFYTFFGLTALGFAAGFRMGVLSENARIGLKINDHLRFADATILFFRNHPNIQKQFVDEISKADFWTKALE